MLLPGFHTMLAMTRNVGASLLLTADQYNLSSSKGQDVCRALCQRMPAAEPQQLHEWGLSNSGNRAW
jgi:hypothetical protein